MVICRFTLMILGLVLGNDVTPLRTLMTTCTEIDENLY